MRILFGQDVYAAIQAEIQAKCRPGRYEGTYDSTDLCEVQNDQYRQGFRGAKLVETMYGWSVRDDSGISNFAILASPRYGNVDGTRESALQWAKTWQESAPARHFVWEYGD